MLINIIIISEVLEHMFYSIKMANKSPIRCQKILFGPFRWLKSFSVFSRTGFQAAVYVLRPLWVSGLNFRHRQILLRHRQKMLSSACQRHHHQSLHCHQHHQYKRFPKSHSLKCQLLLWKPWKDVKASLRRIQHPRYCKNSKNWDSVE